MAEVREGATLERWVYCGRRWSQSQKKIYFLWRDESGENLPYDKVKGTVVGGIYLMNVERKGDDNVSVFRSPAPKFTGDYAEDRVVLVAEDHSAESSWRWNLAEKKAAKAEDEFDQVIDILMPHVKSHADIGKFVSVIRDRMSERYYKR